MIEARKHRKAKRIVVDPRFNHSASVADFHAPIRPGGDIALAGGVIQYLLTNDTIHHDHVRNYTGAAFLVDPGFGFDSGFFSGYDAGKRAYDRSTWQYQKDEHGVARVDPTLQDPDCVFQRMKKHYSRYTPEMVTRVTGTPKEAFLRICGMVRQPDHGVAVFG